MLRVALLTISLAVLATQVARAQSIEGAWRLAEYSSPDGPTYTEPASLMIFADGYYSRVFVRTNDTRQPLTPASTDADRVAAWTPFVSNSGTYTVDGSTLTVLASVAKMPSTNRTPTTFEFRIEGNTLWLTGSAEGVADTTQRWVRASGGHVGASPTRQSLWRTGLFSLGLPFVLL